MTKTNGEFKGATVQAIKDMKQDICDIKDSIKSLERKIMIIMLLMVVAVIERLPTLINLATAAK